MLVQFKVSTAAQFAGEKGPRIFAHGQIVDIPDEEAAGLLAAGHCVRCEETEEAAVASDEGVEKAVSRKKRK